MPPDAAGRSLSRRRRSTKRRARGTIKLKSFVGKRFTPGTVIEIRVTKRGSIGAVKLVTIHANANSIDRDALPAARKEEAAEALLSRMSIGVNSLTLP